LYNFVHMLTFGADAQLKEISFFESLVSMPTVIRLVFMLMVLCEESHPVVTLLSPRAKLIVKSLFI
jgi:hypothetical protein